MNTLVRLFVMVGSGASIGFGMWHFFVPSLWKWYSYIDSNATELVLALRAINVFFSLSLVLFGFVNLLLVWGNNSNRYSILVILIANCILWLTRVAFQIMYPQGAINPLLQFGMLSVFVLISLCYLVSLVITITVKNII